MECRSEYSVRKARRIGFKRNQKNFISFERTRQGPFTIEVTHNSPEKYGSDSNPDIHPDSLRPFQIFMPILRTAYWRTDVVSPGQNMLKDGKRRMRIYAYLPQQLVLITKNYGLKYNEQYLFR